MGKKLTLSPDNTPVNFDEAESVFFAISARSLGDSSPAKLATFPEAFNDLSCVKRGREKVKIVSQKHP